MSNLKTINIKGKEYVTINERILYFRNEEKYTNYKLVSNFIEINENFCIVKAEILNESNEVVATGTAREVNGDTFINKTSYVENCETSAWGRALANLGIGIIESVASADEVINAVNNQNKKETNSNIKPKTIMKTDDICPRCGVGIIQQKISKAGKNYNACSNWKGGCNYPFAPKETEKKNIILDDEIPF